MAGPWAAAAVPLIAGGLQTVGGIFSGLLDETYDVDPSEARGIMGMSPLSDPYGAEAAAAEERVRGIKNPYAAGAMWDQEWARQQQEDYMDDLWATARGEQSLARDQGAETIGRMQDMMRGAGLGGSRFDTGARAASMHQASALPFGMQADIDVAALSEQEQGQNVLDQLLKSRANQDAAAIKDWSDLQGIEASQGLSGANIGMAHASLGSARKRRLLSEAVLKPGIGAKQERND